MSQSSKYYTYAHESTQALKNGSFVRRDGGKLTLYLLGDCWGEVEAVPSSMIEVDATQALRLLPIACGGKPEITPGQLTFKLKRDLGVCPGCASADLAVEGKEGGQAPSLRMRCRACGARWCEHYLFTTASGFVPGPDAA